MAGLRLRRLYFAASRSRQWRRPTQSPQVRRRRDGAEATAEPWRQERAIVKPPAVARWRKRGAEPRHIAPSQGRPRPLVRARPLCRRPAGAERDAARPRDPLPACSRPDFAHRCRPRAGAGGRRGSDHRGRRPQADRPVPDRVESPDPSMVARGRAGALRRRGGGARARGQPLCRRGRSRTGRDRLRAVRSGHRPGCRLRRNGAAAASAMQDQRDFGAGPSPMAIPRPASRRRTASSR